MKNGNTYVYEEAPTAADRERKMMYNAILKDCVPTLIALHVHGVNMHAGFRELATSLDFAVLHDKHKAAEHLLLVHKVDARAKNEHGYTALHRAKSGRMALLLVSEGKADPLALTEFGHTPIDCAVGEGFVDVVEYLARFYKPEVGETPLYTEALKRGWAGVVHALHAAGAVDRSWKSRDFGLRAVHVAMACRDGNAAANTLRALVNIHGADVNAKTYNGYTALHFAVHQSDMLPVLLELGADVNAFNDDGDTPLDLALKVGRARHVDALLAAGATLRLPAGWEDECAPDVTRAVRQWQAAQQMKPVVSIGWTPLPKEN